MKRFLCSVILLAIVISLGIPVTAEASASNDLTAWNNRMVTTSICVKAPSGGASLYAEPAPYDSVTNPVKSTIHASDSVRVNAIGKNARGEYYYRLTNGTSTNYYVKATDVTPDYGTLTSNHYTMHIYDSNGNSAANVVNPTFSSDYRLYGEMYCAGGEAVKLESLTVSVTDSSGNQITGGTVWPSTTVDWNYHITSDSELAEMTDFSLLTVGSRYTMTITAMFLDNYYPASLTDVMTVKFYQSKSFNFTLQQGAFNVTSSGLRVPTSTMTYGEKYTLKGTITATGANLSRVSAYVYGASDYNSLGTSASAVTGTYETINKASYSIYKSKLDNGCKFATLSEGDYVYVLQAVAAGQTFTINTTRFSVVKPSFTITYFYGWETTPYGGAGSIFMTQDKAYGSTAFLTEETPTKQYYDFAGWDTSTAATSVVYHPGDEYTANKDLNLYAVWTPKTYTVIYNDAGGSGGPGIQTAVGDASILISNVRPTRFGYNFTYWSYFGNRFYPGDSLSLNPSADSIELYANYEPSIFYSVVFEPNGGEGSAQTVSKPYGTSVGSKNMFKKAGAVFIGWAYSPDATEQDVISNDYGQYTENADATLYAVWREGVVEFRYQLLWKGGSDAGVGYTGDNNTLDGRSFKGNTCRPLAEFTSYAEYGQVFVSNVVFSTTDVGKPLSEVVWTDENGYRVDPWSRIFADYSGLNPVLEGFYTYLDDNSSIDAAVELTPDFVVDRSLTIFPYWRFNAHKIQYNANVGSQYDGVGYQGPTSQIKDDGTTIQLSNEIPVREGYVFLGWATSSNATVPEYQPGDTYSTDENLILYALWKEQFMLDLTALVEGEQMRLDSFAATEFHVNGETITEANYFGNYPAGAEWSIENIRPKEGYAFDGIAQGGRTGTLSENTVIQLKFHRIPDRLSEEPSRAAYNGHSYLYFSTPVTWYDAEKISEKLGGHLVTISNAAENDFVFQLIGADTNVWIGATDRDEEGSFSWVTEEPFIYTNWVDGEPSNTNSNDEGAETFVHIWGQYGGKWNDAAGCVVYPFVCEIDTVTEIRYEMNNETGSYVIQEKALGEALPLLSDVPIRPGFSFMGWSSLEDAQVPQFHPEDLYSSDEDIVLYAVWKLVEYDDCLILPNALTSIEDEAFSELPIEQVLIPASVRSIGKNAFSNCNGLKSAVFSAASVIIDSTAFNGCDDLVIIAPSGGSVEEYAIANGLPFAAN